MTVKEIEKILKGTSKNPLKKIKKNAKVKE